MTMALTMSDTLTADEYNELTKKRKPGKYGNRKTEVDGVTFDSAAEARRYSDLVLMVAAGVITDLELQPRYPLMVNGQKVSTYVADFRYRDKVGRLVVEDVKGVKTPAYRLKAKLMKAVHNIEVQEVTG